MSNLKLYNILYENGDLVDEMAIQQFKTVGDWSKRSSFSHPVDRALLTSPKAVEKIKRQWENTPYDFDLYFVNDKRVNNPAFREVGYKHLDFVRNILQITPEEIPDPSDDRITIIYTGNFGDERYMASGWILAHRFGHAISRSDNSTVGDLWRKFIKNLADIFKDILSKVYNIEVDLNMRGNYSQINKNQKILKFAAQQIGTMKSARENNLRNWYEFAYELLAQYLISGKIKFNPLPKSIIIGFGPYGRKEMRYTKSEESRQEINSSELDYYASTIEYQLEDILGACLNKIFVM